MGLKHPRPSFQTVHLPGLALAIFSQGQAVFFLWVTTWLCPWVFPEPPQCPFPIVMLGLGGVQQLLPWQPSVICVCLYLVLWGSLCFLGSPHVLE